MTTVGLCLPQLGEHIDGPTLHDFCQSAEALGFASLWVQEHLFYPLHPRSGYSSIPGQPVPTPYQSTLGATETLAAAAAWTTRVAIGTSVLVAGYHRPVELAQRLSTLDVISGGRLIAGFGVGWSEEEHDQMGVDSHSRGRRCDELIRALLACWGPDPVHFNGEFFAIPESIVRPKPVQTPRPALLSGMRSPAGLARTVERFDIWNPSRGDATAVSEVIAELNHRRTDDQAPLAVYHRVFLEPSVRDPLRRPPGMPGVVESIWDAAAAGFESVIVEANFWREITSPAAWASFPARLHRALTDAGLPLGCGP